MDYLKKENEKLVDSTFIISQQFALGKAVRIGHSSVASTKVHGIRTDVPGTVYVFPLEDAGKVFYGLNESNKIVHLDIFHQIASLDPKIVASNIINSLEQYSGWENEQQFQAQCDNIDLQTAKGGGKLTGLLKYARTDALKRAHLNHVHLAVGVESDYYGLLFSLVGGVEKALIEQGIELRKVEKLQHEETRIDRDTFNSSQNVPTDSRLSEQSISKLQDNYLGTKEYYQLIELFEVMEDLSDLEQVVSCFLRPAGSYMMESSIKNQFDNGEKIIKKLLDVGLIAKKRNIYNLTQWGQNFTNWFYRFKGELELDLNRLVSKANRGNIKIKKYSYSVIGSRRDKTRMNTKTTISADSLGWIRDLASTETAKNMIIKKNINQNKNPSLSRQDIMVYNRKSSYTVDICVVLDGSISMAGKRIRAAKSFIRYIAANGNNKLSVILFQGDKVTNRLPFTKNRQKIKIFLEQVRAQGLTPLAEGLREGLGLCRSTLLNTPLLLLITDGQPTTASNYFGHPEIGALEIAKEIASSGIKFCCIGLDPNKKFLQDLTQKAGGVLYIVEEIEKNALISVFQQEKSGII